MVHTLIKNAINWENNLWTGQPLVPRHGLWGPWDAKWLAWNSLTCCDCPGLLKKKFISQGNIEDGLSLQVELLCAYRSSFVKYWRGIPTAPWDHHDHFPPCLTSLSLKYNTGSQPILCNFLFYPHQFHHEFETIFGSLIWSWNTYEKLPEVKKAWPMGGEQDLFTWGRRGPLHELLKEVAKCLMLLLHTHMQVE